MSIPQQVKSRIDVIAKRKNMNRSQLVQEAIDQYLFTVEFQELRAQMSAKARTQGIFTDEDVFKRVS